MNEYTAWGQAAPSLADLAAQWLADGLSAPTDPIARDPAALMALADMPADPWQRQLLQSQWTRALLLCSRQSGKSTVTAALACHMAQFQAGSLVLILSAALRQSQELFRKVLTFYGALPNAVQIRNQSALTLELVNKSRIVALPATEGTVRGYSGVDLLICDEAARVPDELYFATRPMLAVSGGRLIGLSSPFGRRGWFFEEWENGGPDWHRVKITAADCPRITPEFLEEERRAIGDHWFRQEYQVEFLDTIDQAFSYADIQAAFDSGLRPLFEEGIWGGR